MKFIHYAIAIAFVVAILAQPLKAETWIVLEKPGLRVIGTFELEKGGMVNIDIDTRRSHGGMCIKTFEIAEPIPADLKQVITVKESQTVMDGKSVRVVSVSLSKEKIKEGFKKQKYIYNLPKRKFELKEAIIEKVIPKGGD